MSTDCSNWHSGLSLVLSTPLRGAAWVGGLPITTEAMVADKPEKPGAGAPGGGMPDMGGMGGMM
ncbi:Heat shock protein 60 family chaperone GroEL [Candidatus Rhodobacter oscarellae]|uniref:Heat shock protein 60 family chaperone GroEL n=1 Tax=Candidatus Rhodobacter oscarellae TaxID=1675527 RepID=A0A0J9GST3_9RHOB|nr:Heat shock protein 60 family chaperone GroEL [Candidatus Rhodobacter lobularis]